MCSHLLSTEFSIQHLQGSLSVQKVGGVFWGEMPCSTGCRRTEAEIKGKSPVSLWAVWPIFLVSSSVVCREWRILIIAFIKGSGESVVDTALVSVSLAGRAGLWVPRSYLSLAPSRVPWRLPEDGEMGRERCGSSRARHLGWGRQTRRARINLHRASDGV